ncbi:hypothetical protein MC378_14050 [Polaribacter sp. MSW13]|uniref:Uncharacterized protein n=1 Tax=Polaribacter marinus TaxID=2916838 RepID=A0A9X1VQ17_9FLAO|nr:hypothetical protein [Polaribacter marinus]MCI2230297.1 hypothetical protein [Polaribacter marinus]
MKTIKYIIYTISVIIIYGCIAHFTPFYSEHLKNWYYDLIDWGFNSEWYMTILLYFTIVISYIILFLILSLISSLIVTSLRIIENKLAINDKYNDTLIKINKTVAIIGIIGFTVNYWGLMYLLYKKFMFWYLVGDLIFYFMIVFIMNSISKLLNQYFVERTIIK